MLCFNTARTTWVSKPNQTLPHPTPINANIFSAILGEKKTPKNNLQFGSSCLSLTYSRFRIGICSCSVSHRRGLGLYTAAFLLVYPGSQAAALAKL